MFLHLLSLYIPFGRRLFDLFERFFRSLSGMKVRKNYLSILVCLRTVHCVSVGVYYYYTVL